MCGKVLNWRRCGCVEPAHVGVCVAVDAKRVKNEQLTTGAIFFFLGGYCVWVTLYIDSLVLVCNLFLM